MRRLLTLLFSSVLLVTYGLPNQRTSRDTNIYDFNVTDIDGNMVNMARYRNLVCLIVNVASNCALVDVMYQQLQALYDQYAADGLRILAFPCNQFFNMEPGTDEEIKRHVTAKYNVTFDLFHKIDVNGNETIPLYQYLKEKQPGYLPHGQIEYNFVKFLVGRDGIPRERHPPTTPPVQLNASIYEMLGL